MIVTDREWRGLLARVKHLEDICQELQNEVASLKSKLVSSLEKPVVIKPVPVKTTQKKKISAV